MLLRFGIRPAVVVTSPSAVEECFTKTNDIVFANRPLTPLSAKHFNYNYTSMGAAPYGDLWRALRRVAASELLSTTRLDATTHLREHELKLMCRQLINQSSQQVNLKCWFRDLLNNITTMAIMGKRYHGDQVNVGDRKQALEFQGMMEELFKLLHMQNIGDFVPVLGWLGVGGVEKRMIGLMKKVDKFLEEVIEEHVVKGSCESGIMVDKLLVLQQKEPDLYTDQIIKGLILIMLIAGTETPYLTLEWSMSLLLNNPNTMEMISNEISTHIGFDRLLQENDLGKLGYLQNVINESLRLYPTLPLLLPHEASEDITVGGYSVPRGTMLMVNAWAIQRDPVLWDEPNKFMPERFDKIADQDRYKMLAFGVGRRGCPGVNLGYRILGLALGTLIQAFEWEKKIGIEEVDMTAFYGLSMAKLKPLQVLCKPCSNMITHIL
ncbi:cytochrome P450 81Q32 [Helianthus annuus]|uniref:cytochrome P450 81Q32 n=1 Tax=Helianthus annuus TaxID=4232 RepID=UPI001652EBB1|nr:cytochrome P450 81Q32 [Helianthus annuus]